MTEDEEKEEIKKYGMLIKHPALREENNPNKYTDELAYWLEKENS